MPQKPFPGAIPAADAMNFNQKASFNNGYQTVLLLPDTMLWRFVSKQGDRRFGSFWMDEQTMQTIMRTLQANGIFSEQYKKNNVRDHLAVLEGWSNLSWRLKVKLRKEVVAYVGATGTQKQFTETENPFGSFTTGGKVMKATETRIGRQVQYVIPRFAGLPDANPWATIEKFVHI